MLTAEERRAKRQRIRELKRNLYRTDYLAIKYAEGEITSSEYLETKTQRRAWRAEINELEAALKKV